MKSDRRLAILGAGPVGIEAALAASEAGRPFTLYEASDTVAGNVRRWGHVRLFTPWDMVVSPRMRRALSAAGIETPSGDECPTGHEVADRLLEPLAGLPAMADRLRLGTRVLSLGRSGVLKNEAIGDRAGRRLHPFRLLLSSGSREWTAQADIVFDCTGTYGHPNPTGNGGIPAPGESRFEDRICRHLPDFSVEADGWAGRRVLLVGGGHSGQTAAVALAELALEHPETRILWTLRSEQAPVWGEGDDPLPERAELGRAARNLVEGGCAQLSARTGVVVDAVEEAGPALRVRLRNRQGAEEQVVVDRILSLTGFVGDHQLYRQLQVHECWATSGPMKLAAALLSSGSSDCLDQASHGPETLAHPEPDFFVLGIKSYGRTNSFLLQVGWSQVDEVFSLLERG